MSKIIAVHGATGMQGGAVVKGLHNSDWKVRALTRNSTSDSAKALAATGVEVVTADFDDEASLIKAYEVLIYPLFYQPLYSLVSYKLLNQQE